MQGFQFPAMLLVPIVFVLWPGASDNLETLFPALLLSCGQCWAFPCLSGGLQIGFQSYSSDVAGPAINQQARFSAGVFEAAPCVVTRVAAHCKLRPRRAPREVSCCHRCPSSVLVGAKDGLQCLSCTHWRYYFNTLWSRLAFTCVTADGNSSFPVVGIRESDTEVVASSHHLTYGFSIDLSVYSMGRWVFCQ